MPGLIEEKVLALIRSLPKSLRTQLVPAPDTAKRGADAPLRRGKYPAGGRGGARPAGWNRGPADAFQEDRLPVELRMNVRVNDAAGRELAAGRDLEAIRRELGEQAAESISRVDDPRWNRDGVTGWDFDELPAEIELPRGRLAVKAYPSLVDRGDCVALRLADSPGRAEHRPAWACGGCACWRPSASSKSQIEWLPGLGLMELHAATLPGFDVRKQLPSCWPTGPWWPTSRCRAPTTISSDCACRPRADRLGRAGADRVGKTALRGLPPGGSRG